jgi:hypothetical protein
MAGKSSSSSHAILDLGEEELQFTTHDYKTTVRERLLCTGTFCTEVPPVLHT